MEQTIHEEAITAGKRPFGFVQPCIAICASYIFNKLIDVGRQRDALAMTVYKDGKDKSETQRGAGHQAGAFFCL